MTKTISFNGYRCEWRGATTRETLSGIVRVCTLTHEVTGDAVVVEERADRRDGGKVTGFLMSCTECGQWNGSCVHVTSARLASTLPDDPPPPVQAAA